MRLRLSMVMLMLLISSTSLANVTQLETLIQAHIESELGKPRLLGQAPFRWFGLKIYEAQLWAGEQGYLPGSAPLVLKLQYARNLQGSKIAESSDEQMAQLGQGSAAERVGWLSAMRGLFPDVQDGQHLTGVWLPDIGVRFYLNGKRLGEIRDPAFARAFFAIWLDPATSAPALRTALLRNVSLRENADTKSSRP